MKYKAKPVIITSDGTMFEVEEIKKHNLDIQGIRFASKDEGRYYLELVRMKNEGIVTDFKLQPTYVLQNSPKITYVADFLVTYPNGKQVVVDVKGFETPVFKLKKKLFQVLFPHTELKCLKRISGDWLTIEQIKERRQVNRVTRSPRKARKELSEQKKVITANHLRNPSRAQRAKFPAVVVKAAIERSGGICQMCKSRPCTSTHHVVSRARDGRGVLSNAYRVCGSCHIKIEGDESLKQSIIDQYRELYGEYFWLDEIDLGKQVNHGRTHAE